MKKFTHLLYAFVLALLVPQAMMAQDGITISGTTATFSFSSAGALNSHTFTSQEESDLQKVTEVIFNGNFNSDDLKKAAEKTPAATKVDMTNTAFLRTEYAYGDYTLYKTGTTLPTDPTPASGTKAIVGGMLFQASVSPTVDYPEVNEADMSGISYTVYEDEATWKANRDNDPEFTYYKVNSVVRYFKKYIEISNELAWEEIDIDNVTGLTVHDVDWREADNINNINAHDKNGNEIPVGDAIKMEYSAYYVKIYNGIESGWIPATDPETGLTYSDGDKQNITYFFATTEAMRAYTDQNDGQYAIVGGNVYNFNGTSWEVANKIDMYDWSQMRFDYWDSTLREAITSANVDTGHGYSQDPSTRTIVNGISRDIFKGCTELTKVTYSSGNAIGFQDKQEYKLDEVVFGEKVTWISDGAFQRSTLTKFSFVNACINEASTLDLYIDDGAFAEARSAEIVGQFPNRLKSIGQRAFYEAKVGTFEVCEDYGNSRLTSLTNSAFASSKLSTLVVPRSVETITASAFQSTNNLSELRFAVDESTPGNNTMLLIETGAFTGGDENNAPVLEIYLPKLSERQVQCKYDAFNYTQMQGQTSTSSDKFSKLHFDEKESGAWDYYQGEWKRGLAFMQSNLNAFKDGYNDATNKYMGKGDASTWNASSGKYEYSGDGQYTPANGWQQFARTVTGVDIDIPEGNILRTFSTPISYMIPTYANHESIPEAMRGKQMLKAYRITNFDDGYTNGDDTDSQSAATAAQPKAKAVEVPTYMPAATGLLLSGSVSANYLVYLEEADNGVKEYQYKQTDLGDTDASTANLLYPTCKHTDVTENTETDEGSAIVLNPTMPYPIGEVNSSNQDSKYRIFAFNKGDTPKFLRIKKGVKSTRDKAYLKLPASLFHWSNEGSTGTTYNMESDPAGAKGIVLSFDMIDFSETTGIENVTDNDQKNNNLNGYFTLQGVKVDAPTQKGIYIYNGKKIMITK